MIAFAVFLIGGGIVAGVYGIASLICWAADRGDRTWSEVPR